MAEYNRATYAVLPQQKKDSKGEMIIEDIDVQRAFVVPPSYM